MPLVAAKSQALSPTAYRRDRLRGQAPLSLRDISPHCGESPTQRGPFGWLLFCRGGCLHCGVAQQSMPRWGIEPHERAGFAGWRPSFWPPSAPLRP